ncbi:MAG: tetratricopeptide repeat protein [Bryobacteraceae bacterium]|nr:tetratricopeptide repeat protein [Bryobacteraceae bacterium]
MLRAFTILALVCMSLAAQDPAYPHLEKAYASLQAKDYEAAIESFRRAVETAPDRASIRKDLAYALLKVGDNKAARDEFGEARRIDPDDHHVGLEYAFLCFETGMEAMARRIFDALRKKGDSSTRQTAEQAFQNIDRPLADGIARWKSALQHDPKNFSAHFELARLAERRDAFDLALEHYEAAWKLRPDRRALLLDLGRIWKETNRAEKAITALLAASRGAEPRVAEEARALLPSRYPYVYEFEQALALDPANTELRRELAYLHLAMGNAEKAEQVFRAVYEQDPNDLVTAAQLGFFYLGRNEPEKAKPLLDKVLASGDEELADRVRKTLNLPQTLERTSETRRNKISIEAKTLAERSLEKGYLADAMKYLNIAHQNDPTDFSVMLNLGRTHNILKQDEQAILWFDLARRSPDEKVARDADRSYRNLKPNFARFRHTFWMMPFYSTRWRDVFGYSQFKTEVRFGRLPLLPYVSVRFTGDSRQTIGSVVPQYLSESSFIAGVGVRTVVWKGMFAWVEAGSDIRYVNRNDRPSRLAPDYRGGGSIGRGFGRFLGGEAHGVFFDTFNDAVFVSRFNNTLLGSLRNRLGYTAPTVDALGGLQTQFYWNGNATVDTKRQDWANFVEQGPGLRLRWKWMPPSMVFSVELLRGYYLLPNNPRGQRFEDLRAGLWYAFTR